MTEVPSGRRLDILLLLIQHGELGGGDMLKKNNHLKRGSIYTTLHRLEKDTLVTSRTTWDQDGPRRFYTITGYGRKLAQIGKAAASVHTSYWPELLPDPVRSPS